MQLVGQAGGQSATDAGYCHQQGMWFTLATEPIEHREPSGESQGPNRERQAFPNTGEPLQPFESVPADCFVDLSWQRPQLVRRPPVRGDAKRIRSLRLEEQRDLIRSLQADALDFQPTPNAH